ncbi:MAG: hypothetical protein WAU88_07790, partial [Candidatus Zixiibacteriota bacterium]
MDNNKEHFLGKLFKRHPLEYHVAAFVFAILAISLTLSMSLMAEETSLTTTEPSGTTSSTSGTSSNTPTSPTACSYNYSDWGTCQSDGKHYRTITSRSPSSCVETTAPKTVESCTYAAPQCG